MASTTSFIRVYAKAIFMLAAEKKQINEWTEALAFMTEVVTNKDLVAIEDNPRLSRDQIFALLINICKDKVSALNLELLKLLVFKKKLMLLPDIYAQYNNLRASHEKILPIVIKSARALTKEQKQRLQTALERVFQSKLSMDYQVNTGLIGGVILQSGDRVIDGSIRGIWQKLAVQLNTNL